MGIIDTDLISKGIDFGQSVLNNPGSAVILLLILLVVLIIICIVYRKSKIVQKLINTIENILFPIIKKEKVIMVAFTKHIANTKEIKDKYSLVGYKKIGINYCNKFNKPGFVNEKNVQKIIDKQCKNMIKIKKGIKSNDSLIYLGFPHIPIAVMDGVNFSSTDNTILYEYKGALTNSSEKGFFELEKKYNSEIKILSNYEGYQLNGDEIILEIEQSFPINDDEIKNVVGNIDVIYLKNSTISRWGITTYADIDIFVKEFYKVLQWAKNNRVKRIHLVATTPVSLTFSLGKVIEHYHPEIIVYNYNNSEYDWCVNVKTHKVKVLNI